MWSPNGKVWSPEMKNVESKILQSRSTPIAMRWRRDATVRQFGLMIGASLTFQSKGEVYTNAPPPLLVPIFASCVLPLSFSQNFLARYARSIACNRRN